MTLEQLVVFLIGVAVLAMALVIVVTPCWIAMVIMVEFARTTWRSRRSLARFDLAAIMTFILGLSVALAAMRELSILEKIVAGVVVVPASLACASVARIFIEDLWWCSRQNRVSRNICLPQFRSMPPDCNSAAVEPKAESPTRMLAQRSSQLVTQGIA